MKKWFLRKRFAKGSKLVLTSMDLAEATFADDFAERDFVGWNFDFVNQFRQ